MSIHGNRFLAIPISLVVILVLGAATGSCGHGQRRDSTSAAEPQSNMDGSVLERDEMTRGASSVEELFVGRIAGVRLRRAGGRVWFEIRGQNTFSGSNEALVIVDGTESSARALLAMSPADIERIRVLKDASAAMYGVRGANGVLLITTRRRQ